MSGIDGVAGAQRSGSVELLPIFCELEGGSAFGVVGEYPRLYEDPPGVKASACMYQPGWCRKAIAIDDVEGCLLRWTVGLCAVAGSGDIDIEPKAAHSGGVDRFASLPGAKACRLQRRHHVNVFRCGKLCHQHSGGGSVFTPMAFLVGHGPDQQLHTVWHLWPDGLDKLAGDFAWGHLLSRSGDAARLLISKKAAGLNK